MSSTTTDMQFLNANAKATLPEPHFDEEATILSAQPVVPLNEVRSSKARAGFARPWVLGLSLTAALLVGVFATALYFSGSSEEQSGVFEGIEVASGAEGTSDESVNGFSGPASAQPKVETAKVAVASPPTEVRQPARAANDSEKKPQPRLVAVIKERNDKQIDDDQESLEDRRAARREARRERRRDDRERRGKTSDELMRIRDIFEGSPRP